MCEEVTLWLCYLELSEFRMAADETVYSSSTKDVSAVCSVSLFIGACSSRGEVRCAHPRRVGWL